jgi:hypothetical protein
MMPVRDQPLLTHIYEAPVQFVPEQHSTYVFGRSPEDRSGHPRDWLSHASNLALVEIRQQAMTEFEVDSKAVHLRSKQELEGFWAATSGIIYLDITGLSHHVWAPLVRSALLQGRPAYVVYVEPKEYQFSRAPTEGEIFDLSERISGIAPLPGFASLVDTAEKEVCFVPLLGFEGTRLAYLIEQMQPGTSIVPVIGVPGFRIEYPFYAYMGNQIPLLESKAWRNVRYAIANCPFSLYFVLEEISQHFPGATLQVATIGTKPHALGAVLYAINNPQRVELVYDHPIRKAQRTTGSARLLVYFVSPFGQEPVVT